MSIDSLFTFPVTGPTASNKAAGQGTPGSQATLQALGFMDALMTRLATTAEDGEGDMHEPLRSQNRLLAKNPHLDIAALLADSPEIAEEAQRPGSSENTELEDVLALNQKVFDKILRPFGDIEDAEGETQEIIIENVKSGQAVPGLSQILNLASEENSEPGQKGRLRALLNKIENFAKKDHPALIVTNLTPEEITALRHKIQTMLEETAVDAPDESEEIPGNPGGETADKTMPADFVMEELPIELHPAIAVETDTGTDNAHDVQNEAGPDISGVAGRVNALIINALEDGTLAPDARRSETASMKFTDLLARFDTGNAATPVEAPENAGKSGPGTHQTLPPPKIEGLTINVPRAAADFEQLPIIDFDYFDLAGLQNNTGRNLNGLAQLISPVLQSQSAAHPHPAVQMVALNIQKAATNGQNRSFTIQMEPPELGRIQVQMEFGKDKTLKTTLSIEKPETYLMLQRDSHALERALQETGLDTGEGLSFEMAAHDEGFGHNGGHDSHNGQGGGNAESAADIEQIETTMSWVVDPETGHTRYNLLA